MMGTLIRKTEPHQKWSSSSPPTTGPTAKPAALIPLQMPTAAVRSPGSVNTLRTIDRVEGMIVAPATPSSALAAISSSGVGAYAVTAEAAPNAAVPMSSRRLRPMRSPRLPMVTSRPASAKPYMSPIHSSCVELAPRSVTRRGSARCRTVRSSESSSVARQAIARLAPLFFMPPTVGAAADGGPTAR